MNPQSEAWAGEFGTEYTKRSPGSVEANEKLFERVLNRGDEPHSEHIESVIEFGAGVGNNLRALKRVLPWDVAMQAVEINTEAVHQLIPIAPSVVLGSMLDFESTIQWDLAFTKGLLIHIPPADLARAYEVLYKASRRYILIAEYYAPKPTMIPYRGRDDMLWKRDFAGEMLDAYPDLRLLDYGFVYHRDPHPQDDITWFLMEKP